MLTILLTVPIDVVAAEPDLALITADDSIIPTNDLRRRRGTEILSVGLGAVAEAQDMVLGVACELDRIV